MEELYKKKAKQLEKENLELRDKVKFLEDKLYEKLGANTFFTKNIGETIKEFIKSCQDQLFVLTPEFDITFSGLFQKLAEEGKQLTILTHERHQLKDQRCIEAFDRVRNFKAIKLVTNQDIQGNVIIKDKNEVLLSSTRLFMPDFQEKLNFCIISTESQVCKQFENFVKNHLPTFMRE
ncbi:MAG: hypothetical protein ACTSRS_03475 [Candidatus Helarchaeota archaeon]